MTATTTLKPSPLTTLPYDPEKGGSRFGWHFLAEYKTCPMKWFNRYLRAHPSGDGWGCAPRTVGDPLELGTFFHRAIQRWYESAPLTGEYDLEAAIDGIDVHAASVRHLLGEERTGKLAAAALNLMMRHHEYCGPGGVLPEWPTWRPVCMRDTDGTVRPVVERTFEVPLGWRDYVFTSQPDVVVEGHGRLWPLDHKTSAPNRVNVVKREYRLSGQITGQLWCLSQVWGDRVSDSGLVNIVIKDGAASKAPRDLFMTGRLPIDFETFRNNTVRIMKRMNEDVDEWRDHISRGMDPDAAALIVFDSHPAGRVCANEWWPCDFYDGCATRSEMAGWLATETVARVRTERVPAPTPTTPTPEAIRQ